MQRVPRTINHQVQGLAVIQIQQQKLMIQISCAFLQFQANEKIKTFQVSNKGPIPLLYKVKTNNIKAIDARPNTGCLVPGSAAKISVRTNDIQGQNVKIQVTYLQCAEKLTDANFRELWAQHEKTQQSKTLPIRFSKDNSASDHRAQKQQNEEQAEVHDHTMFKSVIASLHEPLNTIKEQKYGKQAHEPEPIVVKKAPVQQRTSRGENYYNPSTIVDRKIEQISTENKNLAKKLEDQQKKIRDYNPTRETTVSAIPANTGVKFSPTILAIAALLFFLLGYYLGRTDSAPVVEQAI